MNRESKIIKASFSDSKIMRHSVLNTVAKFLNRQNIVKVFGKPFPKVLHNATEFGFKQILMAITLSSISGISRICKIAAFSSDSLLKPLLKLDRAINENAISAPLKTWGQRSSPKLQMLLLSKNTQWLHESGLKSITLDADSTVKSVCGNQERASNAFNTTKKREKSCHSLLVFASKMNLLYHTWFRTESAYTANGIVDFTKEVEASLPKNIVKMFFRADSGFFSEGLFDKLESFCWVYLIKVKLKTLEKLLKSRTWLEIKGKKDVSICEFSYTAKGWSKPLMLRAMRSVKEYVQTEYVGYKQVVPVFQYVCYANSYDMSAIHLHEPYKQRSTGKTLIELVY